jgi:hypothetical protein
MRAAERLLFYGGVVGVFALCFDRALAAQPIQRSVEAQWPAVCKKPIRVSFFGDFWVSPHSSAAALQQRLFENLQPLLNWGDFNVVNFEGSLTQSGKRAFPKFPYALRQAPESLTWLKTAGVQHLTRANNHAMDFGWAGAEDTSRALAKAHIQFTGVGAHLGIALRPLWLIKDGIKIAVFSATTTYPREAWASKKGPGVAHPSTADLRLAIQSVRSEADFIVVAFHWGDELKPTVKPHQEENAALALKAGADLVVGHHAHLAQKIDSRPSDGMIVYGLGNFIFSSLSRDATFGLGAHVEFCRIDEPADVESTHSFRVVLSPLMTNNRITGFKTRPMTLSEFLPWARQYVSKDLFSQDLEFYIPSENKVQPISAWLQSRPQASKERSAVD